MLRHRLACALFTLSALVTATSHADSIALNLPPLAVADATPTAEPAFWQDAGQNLRPASTAALLHLAEADRAPALDNKPFSAIDEAVAKRKSFWDANSGNEPRWVTQEQFEKQLKLIHKEIPDPKIGLFGPDSMMWKYNRYLAPGGFGAGQALLLQISHPWITAGIDEHSVVRNKPLARGRNTFRYILTMLYGSRDQALEAARDVRLIHAKIQGHLKQKAGAFGEGSEYRANEEQAMIWVHATLWETQMKMYEESVGKVSDVEKEQYYQETKLFAYLFGIREEALPAHWLDFVAYCDKMRASDQLAVTKTSRELADYLFGVHSLGGVILWPAMQVQKLVTKANLPPKLRQGYGFSDYGWFGQTTYETGMFTSRMLHVVLPDFMLQNPAYKEAKARIKGKKAWPLTRFSLWVAFGDSRLTNDK
jgi:uncharacterized protein (DUF2236 family)